MKKIKKGLTAALIAGVVLSVGGIGVEASYSDIPSSSDNKQKIDYLSNHGVISGYSDGTFRPKEEVTRGQFAAFVARALNLPAATSSFKDVSKSNSLYSEISSASKAGIITGYSDGTFKPYEIVERQQMALMLDRALQHYGKYSNSIAKLSYSDNSAIGKTALNSIKIMTSYGIMGAIKNNKFEPLAHGTRELTASSIYNMLAAAGKIENISYDKTKKDNQLTYAELKAKYGPQNLIRRDYVSKEFEYLDLLELYVDFYGKYFNSYTDYLNESVYYENNIPAYEMYFPKYEMISFNGKSFVDSPIWQHKTKQSDYIVPDILPFNPKQDGQFLVDFHTDSKYFETYYKNDVKTHVMNELPIRKGDEWLVEAKTVFQDIASIKGTSTSNQIVLNGKTINLSTETVLKNGHLMVPIYEVAGKLGYDTRTLEQMDYKNWSMDIINIANFQLAEDITY